MIEKIITSGTAPVQTVDADSITDPTSATEQDLPSHTGVKYTINTFTASHAAGTII